MKRILCALLLVGLANYASVAGADADAGPMVAMRAFMTAVAQDDDATAWNLFTRRSQEGVVKSVADGEHMDAGEVRKLFDTNDTRIRAGFWKSFHQASQAEVFVGAQMASTGGQNGADGSVLITLSNGNSVTMLMFQENGAWKVGWFETFFPNGVVNKG